MDRILDRWLVNVSWPLDDELDVGCRRKEKGKYDSKFKDLSN